MKFNTIRDNRGNTYVRDLPVPVIDRFTGELATHVCMWHNRYERQWVVSLSDYDGRQVGSSEYVYSREDATDACIALWNDALISTRCNCPVSRIYGGDCAHTAERDADADAEWAEAALRGNW